MKITDIENKYIRRLLLVIFSLLFIIPICIEIVSFRIYIVCIKQVNFDIMYNIKYILGRYKDAFIYCWY